MQPERAVDVQIHRVAANLTFDGHGLSPYWGLVSEFNPDMSLTVTLSGEEYSTDTCNYWRGKIADPNGDKKGGLYEYEIGLWTDDEAGDKGASFTFRPGYPHAEHVDTGEEIDGIPTECPESIRVQVEATNLEKVEIYGLLQALAGELDLNKEYFAAEHAHEWSSIYGLETYVRVKRETAERHIVGDGGIFEQIAQFSSGNGSKGEWKWDHEETEGHYEAVALDPSSWAELLAREDCISKRVKCYQPKYPREDEQEEDPLYHHKLESQYWAKYDSDSLDWHEYHDLVNELRETTLNVLNWTGISLDPDGPFVEDAYWTPTAGGLPVEIVPNPIPELEERQQRTAHDQLLDPSTTAAEFEVLDAIADTDKMHHSELADRAGTSKSTVYRAVEQFSDMLEKRNGVIEWTDNVVRKEVAEIVERFESAKVSAYRSIEKVAGKVSPLSDDGEPSALEKWMTRHGIIPQETYEGLKLRIDRQVSRRKLQEILREGVDAAEGSAMQTEKFESATVDWFDLNGDYHANWQVVVDGEILGPVTSV